MNPYDGMCGVWGMAETIGRASAVGMTAHFAEMLIPHNEAWKHRMGISDFAIEQTLNNIGRITMSLPFESISERRISAIEAAVSHNGLSCVLSQQDRMLQNMGNALTLYSSIVEKTAHASNAYSGIVAALDTFQSRVSQMEELGLNYSRIASAVGQVLQRTSADTDFEIDDISVAAAECYEAETDEERTVIRDVLNPDQNEEARTRKTKFSEIVNKIILSLLTIIVTSLIDVGIQKVLNDNPPIINQYYIQNVTNNLVIEGYEVGELNERGYRIVNTEIILRAKPGKSSYVTGHLQKGAVVRVIRQYKKWVEVIWTDENGESCFGWIQNYTLSVFAW